MTDKQSLDQGLGAARLESEPLAAIGRGTERAALADRGARIAHISDLHFGRTDARIVESLSADLKDFSPDLVVVSGDLTQRAKRHQFEEASRFLASLPSRYLVVPGNHDLMPFYRPVSRLFFPLKNYSRWLMLPISAQASLGHALYESPSLVVVGLNSTARLRIKEGGLSSWQLSWLKECLVKFPRAIRVVVTHHPLLHPERGVHLSKSASRRLKRLLRELQVDLALSGHLHDSWDGLREEAPSLEGTGDAPENLAIGLQRPDLAETQPAAEAMNEPELAVRSTLFVQASTATSTRLRGEPNAYNRLIIGEKQLRIEVRRFMSGEFQSEQKLYSRRQLGS